MTNAKEIRRRAWDSLKGKYWMALIVTIVTGFIYSIGTSIVSYAQEMTKIPAAVDPAMMDEEAAIGALVIYGMALVVCFVGVIVSIFVSSPALVGCCSYFIKNTDSKPSFAEAFSGYKTKYGRNIGTLLLMGVKTVLWTLLFIIPGIIKAYEYAMIPYILADDATITCKEAFKKSKEMMKGNKMRLFLLQLSFIGWEILGALALGVGIIFVVPYVEAATAEFYVELKNK